MPLQETGTVSHGTLRSQDLLPAFAHCLGEMYHEHHHPENMVVDSPEDFKIEALRGWDSELTDNDLIAMKGDMIDQCEYWYSDDCVMLISNIIDAINDLLPEGYHFGAHEGDGSDFGVWEDFN